MRAFIITAVASFLMLADLSGQWEIVRDTVYPNNIGYINRQCFDACFINKETGFMVEYVGFHKGVFGSVWSTNNGGKSWNRVFSVGGIILEKCKFVSNSIGFVTCRSGGFYQTSDGGVTWIKKENGLLIKDLFFVNENIGFAAADTSIYMTSNTGESWERILYDKGLNSIFFINDSTGWAVGVTGLILKLSDKGSSEKIASGTTLPLKKVLFTDRNTGWIAGGYSNSSDGLHPVLLKTVNGGESWVKIENINWLMNDFYFLNNLEGWAVGSDSAGKGIIVETYDGGINWSVQVSSLRVPLVATDFKDGYGWAIGNGLVLKKEFAMPLVSFGFVPPVCKDAAAFNLTQGSPDGGTYSGKGITVSPQFDPAVAGTGTHTITYTCTDSLGYAHSATQTITVNATPNVTFGTLAAVCLNTPAFNLAQGAPTGGTYSGMGIATSPQFDPVAAGVGTHTITYTYSDGIGCTQTATQNITVNSCSTGIEENDEISENDDVLFPNYPNPFSSRTSINYQLSVICDIELCIYDITFRKVAILVKETQQTGKHQVEWNAEGMTPGIYLYELRAGHCRNIRKMILLK